MMRLMVGGILCYKKNKIDFLPDAENPSGFGKETGGIFLLIPTQHIGM
jgi:hypothetical protein